MAEWLWYSLCYDRCYGIGCNVGYSVGYGAGYGVGYATVFGVGFMGFIMMTWLNYGLHHNITVYIIVYYVDFGRVMESFWPITQVTL